MGTLTDSKTDRADDLRLMIDTYNAAWNAHDLDTIMSLHAPGMVFHNHTAGERAVGEAVREHIAGIFESWPDLRFQTVRLYVCDGVITQEWTAYATHGKSIKRGDIELAATGATLKWEGVDVIPVENGLIKRKDVYSDSVSILRQLGFID
ncbi:MAG: nuclear transport factor 2 family protein [Actinobacteria bacterium]|nr:nuclear transport factor 2 family protein [Actinomycetota bacterium]